MLLRADNLALVRGGRRLFSELSFTLSAGQALVVKGENGAGKTSLLRAIAGLLPLAGGKLLLEGGDEDAPLGEQANYLGHADALKSALTVAENLEFWAAMLAPSRPAATALRPLSVAGALDRLGLGHVIDFPIRALSAGQKRRVALARLLVAGRPLWLLDEPLTALDLAAQARLTEILRAHLAGGGLLVAATHAPIDLPSHGEVRLGAALIAA